MSIINSFDTSEEIIKAEMFTQGQKRLPEIAIVGINNDWRTKKHLKDIDDNASDKVKNIIDNLAKKDNFPIYYDGIIDQLERVKTMNNYKNIAEEIVYKELIYC